VATRGKERRFCLDGSCRYADFAGRVRVLIFDAARSESGNICLDGPGYTTQYRQAGTTYTLNGFCAERHPNAEIQAMVKRALGRRWPGFGGPVATKAVAM